MLVSIYHFFGQPVAVPLSFKAESPPAIPHHSFLAVLAVMLLIGAERGCCSLVVPFASLAPCRAVKWFWVGTLRSGGNPLLVFVRFLLLLCFFLAPSHQPPGIMSSFLSVCARGDACGPCTTWAWSQQLSSLSAFLMSLNLLSVNKTAHYWCPPGRGIVASVA